MDPFAFSAVLLAAALHASWNSIVKGGTDRLQSVLLISVFAAIVSAMVLPFVPMPRAEAWPWLLASVALHVGYKMFLVLAYRSGDMGQVYTIARGTAPLLVFGAMFLLFGETVSLVGLAGVVVLVMGILLMCVRGGADPGQFQGRAVGFSVLTSLFIASYTVADGVGARANVSPAGYGAWMFFIDGLVMVTLLGVLYGRESGAIMQRHWRTTAPGGLMMLVSYWTVIWAMTVEPIALVSALRESSVLFAALISVVLLREPFTVWRMVSAVAVVVGIVLMRLA